MTTLRLIVVRLIAALWFSLALSTVAPAQQPDATPAPAAEASAGTSELEGMRKDLDRLTDLATRFSTDDTRLSELKVEVDDVAKRILALSVASRPRLDEIKARLTELGDPPGEGAPPEAAAVTAERDRLNAERGEINALTGQAETLSVAATQLSKSITATRRALFSNTLLKYTDINRTVLSDGWAALSVERQVLARNVQSWLNFVWKFKKVQLLSAIFLSLCAGLFFLAGSDRLFSPLVGRRRSDSEPGYLTRLSTAFFSTLIPTVAACAFAASSYLFLQSFNVLRTDIAPIVSITLAAAVAMLFLSTLTRAVLAPADPAWRLVAVSDRGARLLSWTILAMAVVNTLDFVLGTVSEVLGSPVVLTVVKSFVASIVIGLILIAMSFIRPLVSASGEESDAGRPWPRAIRMLLLLAGAVLIASALAGYVGLSRFIATQIVVTGAVVATMYIGLLTGKAVAKQNAFANTVAGRQLESRFGLEQVTLDQIGLVAGLAIYALVAFIFLPLIFLQWGFQIADIQSFAYRAVTDIRIGTITISLVGILAGVLLFILGYVVTRWFQRWLDNNVMARSRVDAGVRNSIRTGVGYLGVGLAGLFGISAAGLDLSSLALVAGALSLGVGFGLQNIVSNFVSGLILLVERPFKVGDWVVTGTTEGFVRRISVRATEIETFQRQSIMVPNSLFINASVGNWTHRNKLGRTDIPVVVSYDVSPRRVMDLLTEIADGHPLVLRNPAPLAVFSAFGEATMTFELRVFLADIVNGAGVRNDLRLAIFERFRAEGLGMPFSKADPPVTDAAPEGEGLEPKVPEETPMRVETEAAAAAKSAGSSRNRHRRRRRAASDLL
ncbi:mechanosensitive ion channel domain-containing protein [Ensifer soli]|uniref:mechanosensitive ion channel domain-containing protein n=1 Tax=Ciceribacter sp. sgz301302 TaxID=3342379 RepID=UPI0035BB3AD1